MSKDPVNLKIADPYARAFVQIVEADGSIFPVIADMQALLEILTTSRELKKCLISPLINDNTKYAILMKFTGSNLNEDGRNYFRWLIERKRISILPTILQLFLDTVTNSSRVNYYTISTAKRMPRGSRKTLNDKIIKTVGSKDLIVEFKIDKTLIGGLLLEHRGKVIDYSVKNILKTLAKQLDTVLKL